MSEQLSLSLPPMPYIEAHHVDFKRRGGSFVGHYWKRPIANNRRDLDWQVVRAGYVTGDPVGVGATLDDAFNDLMKKEGA